MILEAFEKLKKVDMIEEYKKLMQSFVDLEGTVGAKEELEEIKANYKKLNIEHNKLKETNKDLLANIKDLNTEINSWVEKTQQLEEELENNIKSEDDDYENVPYSKLSEDKLVELLRSQNSTINKQARKLKKYKVKK